MIAATDLRIGNVLLYNNVKHDKFALIVEDVSKYGINYEEGNHMEVKFSELLPIKLTPEILEQVGFELKYAEYYGIDCDGYFGSYDFLDVGNGIQVFDDEGCKVVLLEYLHDIQNFYYQFTKQELPIDINTLKV
jgi:hypothetical protein